MPPTNTFEGLTARQVDAILNDKGEEWFAKIEQVVGDDVGDMIEEKIKHTVECLEGNVETLADRVCEIEDKEFCVDDHEYEINEMISSKVEYMARCGEIDIDTTETSEMRATVAKLELKMRDMEDLMLAMSTSLIANIETWK